MMETLLFVLAIPVFVLDLVMYLVRIMTAAVKGQGGKSRKNADGLYSVIRGNATETHGAPRSVTKDPLIATYGDSTTVYEMIQAAIETYGQHRIAMQYRKFVELKKLHDQDRFPTKIFDDQAGFHTITYEELGTTLKHFGAGLREMGMTPMPAHDPNNFDSVQGDFKMVIFEDTCAQWTMALHGALSQSMTVATCYATLGPEAVASAVQETEAATLLVNWKNVEAFAKRASDMPSLKAIIASTNEMPQNATIYRPPGTTSLKVFTFDEVVAMGEKNSYSVTPPKPSDVAVIMYTSGSTGKPKGVVMRHSNLVAGIGGMITNVNLRPGQERFVSYLPLAHILALQVENALLSVGATLSYTDPREMAQSLSMFQPTIFGGVPKVYEMLQMGLEGKLRKGPIPIRLIFETLVRWKMFVLKKGGDTPVSNKFFALIGKKLFGGQLQFAVTGGGPIGESLHYFCRAVFNCPIIQGYALTETCVGGCFQTLDDTRTGVVGPPVPCVEIMLQSEPDFKDSNGNSYLHTDRIGSKGEPILGRGEVCFRGPSVSVGYFKSPDKTKEAYDNEGFFHSGDIGQFTKDGVIQIIDRKKNLVKLKGGEYVAVEAMETAFSASKYVSAICVIASGELDSPLAIVLTQLGALKQWAKERGLLTSDSVKDLSQNAQAREEVLKSMIAEGKQAGLTSLELRLKDCCLITDDEWKPGHGMTASMKLDRRAIYQIHAKELHEMYQRNGIHIKE